jgi:transcriptional regulator with XRE-family HTH domain
MANGQMKENHNCYFQCRKAASAYNDKLSSREGAAELLGVSVSSLADYELGNTKVVPVDKVVLMSDLYNAPQLKAQYCANECPIGSGEPIPTDSCTLESAVLKLICGLSPEKIKNLLNRLAEIAADGKVQDDEKADFLEQVSYLDNLQKAVHRMRLFGVQQKRRVGNNG